MKLTEITSKQAEKICNSVGFEFANLTVNFKEKVVTIICKIDNDNNREIKITNKVNLDICYWRVKTDISQARTFDYPGDEVAGTIFSEVSKMLVLG